MDESIKNEQSRECLDYVEEIRREFSIKEKDPRQYSPLALAYIGDGIYDLVIRTMVVEQGNARVNQLHKKVSNMVKASFQAQMIHKMQPYLTEEERSVYKRGRNAKSYTMAKNASVTDYRHATGFEALMGYLYLAHQFSRILELVKIGLEEADEERKPI